MDSGKFTVYINEPVVPNSDQQGFAKLLDIAGSPSNYEEFREIWKHKWDPTMGTTIRVFRSDKSPLWEDKCNASGGKLGLIIKEADRADSAFLKIVAAMMRDELSESDKINGVLLSPRRSGFALSVWHCSANSAADCVELECDLRILLDTTDLTFRTHKELSEISSIMPVSRTLADSNVAPKYRQQRVEPRFAPRRDHVDYMPKSKAATYLDSMRQNDGAVSKAERRSARKQPTVTLAQLEQQWERDWCEQRQWEDEQKFTLREWLIGLAVFALTATVTTSCMGISLY